MKASEIFNIKHTPPPCEIEPELKDWFISLVDAYFTQIGDVVVTKNLDGQILAVTRQDEDGQVLKIIAMSEKQT